MALPLKFTTGRRFGRLRAFFVASAAADATGTAALLPQSRRSPLCRYHFGALHRLDGGLSMIPNHQQPGKSYPLHLAGKITKETAVVPSAFTVKCWRTPVLKFGADPMLIRLVVKVCVKWPGTDPNLLPATCSFKTAT